MLYWFANLGRGGERGLQGAAHSVSTPILVAAAVVLIVFLFASRLF